MVCSEWLFLGFSGKGCKRVGNIQKKDGVEPRIKECKMKGAGESTGEEDRDKLLIASHV